jgi:ABC-type lipoprotein release transport system permease subunit
MRFSHFILQSARHYWKSHAGLLFGAFLASAILSGSLVVGDSVRASLRKVAAARLGQVTTGMIGGDRWFTTGLADSAEASLPDDARLAALTLLPGSASAPGSQSRVNGIQLLGIDDDFWSMSLSGQRIALEDNEIAINRHLARKLRAKIGDSIIVRVERPGSISRDAPLSGSSETDVAVRRKVAAIVADEDFGVFQLHAQQTPPDNAFVTRASLEYDLEKPGRANVLLASSGSGEALHRESLQAALDAHATLADFSLVLKSVDGGLSEWEISTDRVFLDPVSANHVLESQPGAYPVLTYLVNAIATDTSVTPYSMIAAVDRMGAGDGIAINQWLADDHNLKVGDSLTLRFFVMTTGRKLVQESADFRVQRVIAMEDADMRREWTPEFPGVSDADNCRDWEPGIPVDLNAIRDEDETYWDDYKGTPKGFISLEAGRDLWRNRFGDATAVRFEQDGRAESEVAASVLAGLVLSDVGFLFRDLASEAGAAAEGSVDFGGLFIGLSMFLIAAALVFAALLFLFTLERRAPQMGLQLALGWTPQQVRRAMLAEAGVIAVAGSAVGILGGIVYTQLALSGLSGAWSGATQGLQLSYFASPTTLAMSFLSAAGISLLTLAWAGRKATRTGAPVLLSGRIASAKSGAKRGKLPWLIAIGSLAGALALGVSGRAVSDPQALAGTFFGAGSLLLVAGLAVLKALLGERSGKSVDLRSLTQIGVRNIRRHPGRSLAAAGMMAGGIFLVAAVNAFRVSGDQDSSARNSGTGGFALIGESSLPIYEDLNAEETRETYGLEDTILEGVGFVPLRSRPGDDASCLNLNRSQKPPLVAVDASSLADRKAFQFVDPSATWSVLETPADSEDTAIAAVVDQNTAMWGLGGKGVGDVLEYQDAQGRSFDVRIAAMLLGSVLQGKLIVDEDAFVGKFPDAAGYQTFLIDAPTDRLEEIRAHLTHQLEPRGLALEPTVERLATFNSVQNTYIGIFTVLGGLGVLLGTAGLGVLVSRHVLERRGELGLMLALGFRQGSLRRLVMGEHVVLLTAGLGIGLISAALSVWPALSQGAGDLPVRFLGALLAAIWLFGFVICRLAVGLALRGRLLDSIRRE